MQMSVHHFGMTVSSIEETQRFYGDHFGFRPSEDPLVVTDSWFGEGVERPGARVRLAWISRDDAVIELHEYLEPASRGVTTQHVTEVGAPHIAFKVENIDEMCAQLVADGARLYSPPVTVSADGSAASLAGVRWCYLQDPNGYIVELFTEPDDRGVDWSSQMS